MDYSNFDEIENLIRKMKRELEEEKAKNRELQDENEPKRAKVSFAIRPSRYMALVEIAEALDKAQGGLLEDMIEYEYAKEFPGEDFPTAEEAGHWFDNRKTCHGPRRD